MKKAIIRLTSTAPMSQGRYHATPKLDRELDKDYEERTWREKLHYDEETNEVLISPLSLKNCLAEAAKFISMKIPGKGKSTYTKHFESGIMVIDPIRLGIDRDDIGFKWLFVPSTGVRGDGKRVQKCFPVIPSWSGECEILIFDDIITKEPFIEHLTAAGRFIGLGSLRIRNNGIWGSFGSELVKWEEI